jgi:ribosomal protein S21
MKKVITDRVKKYGTYVEVKNNDIESALKNFKRKVKEFRILELYREKQEYVKPSEKRKRAKRASILKQKKNRFSQEL